MVSEKQIFITIILAAFTFGMYFAYWVQIDELRYKNHNLKFITYYGFWKTEFNRYFKYAAYTSDIL